MDATLNELRPWLAYGAGYGGAGVVTFFVFRWLRARDWPGTIDNTLCSPEYARYTVMVLSLVISVLCSMAVAFIDKTDIVLSIDVAMAEFVKAFVVYFFSQVTHARLDLPNEPARKLSDVENTDALGTNTVERITGL